MSKKPTKSQDFTEPGQFELWADLQTQNGHLRRNNWLHWAVHAVMLLAVLLLATRPLMAVRVDTLGAASLVGQVEASNEPGAAEAEHVSRLVAGYLLEVTSGAVQRDIGKALELMTSDFARAYRAKVQEDTTLAIVEKGNVRTRLTFEPQLTEVKAEKDGQGRVQRYLVQMGGKLEVFRADAFTSPLVSRDVVVRTTLLVVPRTTRTLNGLLVEFFDREFLQPRPGTDGPSTSPLPLAPATATRPVP